MDVKLGDVELKLVEAKKERDTFQDAAMRSTGRALEAEEKLREVTRERDEANTACYENASRVVRLEARLAKREQEVDTLRRDSFASDVALRNKLAEKERLAKEYAKLRYESEQREHEAQQRAERAERELEACREGHKVLQQTIKGYETQLVTAHKQAAALARACWDARAKLKQMSFLEAPRAAEAHDILDGMLKQQPAFGRDYVHKSEVEKAVKETREQCAQQVDDAAQAHETWVDSPSQQYVARHLRGVAQAIRARGKK